jgi:anaerobic magnesium-protoporphyrin IX monomethyl ester cyclase
MTALTVIIPAYNEESGIAEITRRVLSVRPALAEVGVNRLDLLVIDDGSADDTARIAGEIDGVRVISHNHNRGYGAALKTGFALAVGELIGFLDADGTYPPEYLPILCQEAMNGADLVIGSRMSGAESQMPATRKVGNLFFASLLSVVGRQVVRDCASGMRVFRREILERIYPLPDGLNLTPVMSTRAIHEGLRMAEVPIPYSERLGRSKLSVVRDGSLFLHSILWTVLTYNPVRILGLLGLGGLALSALVGAGLIVARVGGVTSLGPWGVVALFAAAVSGVSGISLFTLGVTFNYLITIFSKKPVRQGLFGRADLQSAARAPLWASWGSQLALWLWLGCGQPDTGSARLGNRQALVLLAPRGDVCSDRPSVDHLVDPGSSAGRDQQARTIGHGRSWPRVARQAVSRGPVTRKADMTDQQTDLLRANLGTRRIPRVRSADFPNADDIVRDGLLRQDKGDKRVDIVLVNPPTPDGDLWIRTQHRVGRRTRENMVWPQVSLAQMAALLHPAYSVAVIDANAERMAWPAFAEELDRLQPRFYLTQVTAPTLENDMYGCFLAKARGARTIAFGTHVTPIPRETMRSYPVLDYVIVGEPDLTLRDLLDHLEDKLGRRDDNLRRVFQEMDPSYQPAVDERGQVVLQAIKGLVWRRGDEIVMNPPRPFIANLDDLPTPMHELLPLDKYRMPLIKGPFTFIVTSRGCPAGCTYCIKHVSYQYSTRLRSPELLMEEMWHLKSLGIHNIHMYADLFTVSREQVVRLCELMIAEEIDVGWTCNSRVDYVDEEMLQLMGRAGCRLISWGIESGNEQVLRRGAQGSVSRQGGEGFEMVESRRHHELGLLHHRPAWRD